MPEIEFTINMHTGAVTSHTKGFKGKACDPIQDAIASDLSKLGSAVTASEDTPERREKPLEVQQVQRLHLGG